MFTFSTTARKSLAIASIAALSVSAVACNRGESSDGADGGSVTLALSTQTNPFFVELRDGAQAKADELGIDLDIQDASDDAATQARSEEHTSELQSRGHLVCRLLLEKKKYNF